MKTLTKPKVSLAADGRSVTINFDIVERPVSRLFIQRSSITHTNPGNLAHPRHILISNEGLFLFFRQYGVAIPNDDFALICAAIEPKTTFAPVFDKSDNDFTVNLISEIDATFQWQVTDSIKPTPVDVKSGKKPEPVAWANIAGATKNTLDVSLAKSGQYVRCLATNAAGTTASEPRKVK